MVWGGANLVWCVGGSLVAAYMSTISTHLNWGASYVVNDFYKQQIKPNASETHLVNVGRITTVVLMIISSLIALSLTNALQLFDIILMFGAGTGLIFILRWFWWRINAWTEISAMLASGIISILLTFTPQGQALFVAEGLFPGYFKFPFVVIFSTIIWLVVTFLTAPESDEVLFNFYKKIQPGGPGWKSVLSRAQQSNINIVKTTGKWSVPNGILAMIVGSILIYACMFAIGNFIYGQYDKAMILVGIIFIFCLLLINIWKKIKGSVL